MCRHEVQKKPLMSICVGFVVCAIYGTYVAGKPFLGKIKFYSDLGKILSSLYYRPKTTYKV